METRLASALEGRYVLDRKVGAGGMATVYLARDLRHKRSVALKVLNPELGAVLGVERFLAEIQVTANLQHPNLLPLFDSGEADGLLFYVMPFVEGESLRAKLQREKQLPVPEALRIAGAVANALDYAHRHGVIHRDLKPENILMHEGQPLLADFGIALAVSNAGGERITQTGLSLGTPQYMSPEQATGDRAVDARTDIYSLGVITYEMLVGDPPYLASTSQAIIAKLLTETPASVRANRPSVPPHVDAAIATALEKLPADRFATAKAFADALEHPGLTTEHAATGRAPATARGWRWSPALVAGWLVAAALALTSGWLAFRPAAADAGAQGQVIRANFDLPPGVRVNDVIPGPTIAVSPAGDMLAFTATGTSGFRMYLRKFSEVAARQITDNVGRNLTFSPDGRWLAYTEGNIVKKVAVSGGEPSVIGETGGAVPYGLAWSTGDSILIGSFTGLWTIPARGGSPSRLLGEDANQALFGFRWPVLLPGGRAVVCAAGNSSTFTTSRLSVVDLATLEVKAFDIPVVAPLGIIGDQLVYVSPTGALMAVRFDVRQHRLLGDPVQLEEGVLVDPTAGAKAALSTSGTLSMLRGRAHFQPVLIRPGGPAGQPVIREPGIYQTPRFSPDGRRIAMTVFGSNSTDVWIYDLANNTFTRLTTEGFNLRPEWTPDGKRLVFVSTRQGKAAVWTQPVDGSGDARLLYQPEVEPFETLVSPDAKWLLIRTSPSTKYPRDILAVSLADTQTVLPIVVGPASETQPRVSPDGRWLAYQSNESGRFEVYVRPFPGPGARVQVSDQGGSEPLWGRDGRGIYYRSASGGVVRVDVATGPEFSQRARTVLLEGDYLTDATHANYDVAPDGRLLMLQRAGADAQTIVVHNWGRELREQTRRR